MPTPLTREKAELVNLVLPSCEARLAVIESWRKTPKNWDSVSFAILNEKTSPHQAFQGSRAATQIVYFHTLYHAIPSS